MKILVDGTSIIAYAPHIEFGKFDEDVAKWGAFNTEDVKTRMTLFYVIDHEYTLVENVELPSDFTDGKYFFVNGEFVLDEDWRPPLTTEERIAELERQLANLNGDAVWDEMAVAIEEGVNQV